MGECVSQHAPLGQLGADVDHLEQGHEEGRGDAALDCKDGCLSDRVSGGAPHVRHWGRVRGPGADPALIVWWGSWRSSPGTPTPSTQLWCRPPAGTLERGSWSGLGLHRLIGGPGAAVVGLSGA
mgnify:CR=1 FL=1